MKTHVPLSYFLIALCWSGLSLPTQADSSSRYDAKDGPIEAAQRFSPEYRWQPAEDEASTSANGRRPLLGLALAGGGTRASQIAIGVLEGLHRANVLAHVDVISSVSGGSYAAYWYYSQRLQGQNPDDLFRDCVPSRYAPIAKTMAIPECQADDKEHWGSCICPGGHSAVVSQMGSLAESSNFTNVLVSRQGDFVSIQDPFLHQNNLRGHIDLFSPEFSYSRTGEDWRIVPAVAGMAVTQFPISIPYDGITDVLFDWNTDSSVSKARYRAGIGRIYGQVPVDCASELDENKAFLRAVAGERWMGGGTLPCLTTRPLKDELAFAHSHPEGPSLDSPDPAVNYPTLEPISFERLRKQYGEQASRQGRDTSVNRLPYWVLNATTPVVDCDKTIFWNLECIGNKLGASGTYPPYLAGFEFSAFSWGSGEHLFRKAVNAREDSLRQIDNHGLSLLDAVSASAAFFDPNEKSITIGGLANFGQQLLGFKWGYYIPNPNVSDDARTFHKLLPFPFYLMHRWRETRDSVDIHLLDGGQNDNLGVYPLIRRRVKNIIISDHAEDVSGTMDDLCNLKKWLKDPGFAKKNGDLIWVINFDDMPNLDEVCEYIEQGRRDGLRYNYLAWRHPVQRGCAVELQEVPSERKSCQDLAAMVAPGDHDSKALKLFLIKPAINLDRLSGQLREVAAAAAEQASQPREWNPEILGFLKENRCRYEPSGTLLFPRHGTIALTLNSSPWLYGAYREVAADAAVHLSWNDGRLTALDAGEEVAAPVSDVLQAQKSATATLRALDLGSLATQRLQRGKVSATGSRGDELPEAYPTERCP